MNRCFLILTVALACLAPWGVAVALDAQGIVYNDANGNGARDAGERGIADVLVSNGVDVVATDKSGHYSVPMTDDSIVFVIKPRGWMTPVGPGNNIPRFYYIHKPNGSPKMTYDGVAPTGPLPGSVDFPLARQKERNRFTVLCMGDTQTSNVGDVQFLSHDLLEEIKREGVDAAFGMTLGDNVNNDLTVFEPLVAAVSTLDMPWRYVIGNHDHNHDAPTVEATDDGYERVFGPSYYAFNYGPVHFIVLDDILHDAKENKYHGGLDAKQLAFVKNDLAHVSPKQLVVLLMHIPLGHLESVQALYALLKDFPHTLSLSAHTHTQRHVFVDKPAGWQRETPHHHVNHGTACGSWWGGFTDEIGVPTAQMGDGGPNNYSYITFDGTDYDFEFRVPRREPGYQLNAWLPERIAAADAAKTAVIANVFAGSEKSMARMRVDDATDWIPMEQFTGKDPFMVAAFEREQTMLSKVAGFKGAKELDKEVTKEIWTAFDGIIQNLAKPSDTPHLWRANLPAGLTPGGHTVLVETTDMFGRTYSARRLFIVE